MEHTHLMIESSRDSTMELAITAGKRAADEILERVDDDPRDESIKKDLIGVTICYIALHRVEIKSVLRREEKKTHKNLEKVQEIALTMLRTWMERLDARLEGEIGNTIFGDMERIVKELN
jgi:hypothetical protein